MANNIAKLLIATIFAISFTDLPVEIYGKSIQFPVLKSDEKAEIPMTLTILSEEPESTNFASEDDTVKHNRLLFAFDWNITKGEHAFFPVHSFTISLQNENPISIATGLLSSLTGGGGGGGSSGSAAGAAPLIIQTAAAPNGSTPTPAVSSPAPTPVATPVAPAILMEKIPGFPHIVLQPVQLPHQPQQQESESNGILRLPLEEMKEFLNRNRTYHAEQDSTKILNVKQSKESIKEVEKLKSQEENNNEKIADNQSKPTEAKTEKATSDKVVKTEVKATEAKTDETSGKIVEIQEQIVDKQVKTAEVPVKSIEIHVQNITINEEKPAENHKKAAESAETTGETEEDNELSRFINVNVNARVNVSQENITYSVQTLSNYKPVAGAVGEVIVTDN